MSYNYVIKSDDPKAISMLTENIGEYENRNKYMKTVNEFYNQNGTTMGCPGVEYESAVALDARVKDGQTVPYPEQFFVLNNKEIERLKGNIDRLQNKPETVFKSWVFVGGEAVVNLANNRLQLMFNDKPAEERINVLKQNGFKWARRGRAWQRPLTYQTMSACNKIDFIKLTDGRKPTDIQPKQPKRNEPER